MLGINTSSPKLVIPKQRNGDEYDAEQMSDEQKAIVYNAVDTVIKFLNNAPSYKPTRATIMKSAGLSTQSHVTILREYSFNTGHGPRRSL